MDGMLVDIVTTVFACTTVCLNNGNCNADGTCTCLPGYYGENCQNIGYNGYSTIGAIAGAVICIVFLLLLTCMAFAAHIRGPQGNGESRLTRLVSVEARGSSFDENIVLAQNDFPPEYADAVGSGRGRRFSSLRRGSRTNSVDETEPRSPPPMYEIVIFGKKRKFSFRRGSKSRKTSEMNEANLENKDCIIEEVNEKYGDDSVFTTDNTTESTRNSCGTIKENKNSESENTVATDRQQEQNENNSANNLEQNIQEQNVNHLQNINYEQNVNYEQKANSELENIAIDTCVLERVSQIDEQRHRQKHEDGVKNDDKVVVAISS